MRNNKITLMIVAGGAMVFLLLSSCDNQPEVTHSLVAKTKLGASNEAVYMSGCRTNPNRVPPKIVYKTVRKNFVTLPCALEVPPPYGAIEWQKLALHRVQ